MFLQRWMYKYANKDFLNNEELYWVVEFQNITSRFQSGIFCSREKLCH